MQALFEVILPVFVVVSFGYLATWWRLLGESTLDGLVKFTQIIAIPCLLFRAISDLDLGNTVSGPLIASYYFGAFVSFFAGFAGARWLIGRTPEDAITIGFCCLFSNTILLGIPITERAFGSEALADNFAIIAFHAPLCYFVGVTAMELVRSEPSTPVKKASRIFNSMFRNPFVIGIALGFVVNITGLPLPKPFTASIDLIAQTALPIALFGLGGVLVQYRPEGDLVAITMVCAISLMIHPAIVWGTGKTLALDQPALRSAVVTASMAPGVNTYIFANMYGAARRVAASSVLIATAISIFTVWIWLTIVG